MYIAVLQLIYSSFRLGQLGYSGFRGRR